MKVRKFKYFGSLHLPFPGRMVILLSFALLACVSGSQVPELFEAKTTKIRDGDTIEVMYEGVRIVIRLAEIDCPEGDQPYGDSAELYMLEACMDSMVTIRNEGVYDHYGRMIGEVLIGGKSLNMELIASGLAWHYKRYSESKELDSLEVSARNQRLGLWAADSPVAPWVWRKQH